MELKRETDESTLTVTNTPPAVNGVADRKSVSIAGLEQHHRPT